MEWSLPVVVVGNVVVGGVVDMVFGGPWWTSWVVEDVAIISRLLLILWRNPAFLPSTDGCWLHRTALPPEQGRSGGICLG